jgi:hypothetical protein
MLRRSMLHRSIWPLMAAAAFGAPAIAQAAESAPIIQNRAIGYVLTDEYWALFQTPDGKTECPQGFNDGPREQFKVLFPDDGVKRSYAATAMAREADVWFPQASDSFPFHEATGKTSFGLNLDGKIGEKDFSSPDGEKGIDNQMYRALGCISNYRGPDGTLYFFTNKYMQDYSYNRVVVELTDVDSLTNDDDVTLTTYRGLDQLLTDATGKDFMPRGTQRLDTRWGKDFIQRFHGKIKNGVLETDAADLTLPASAAFQDLTVQVFRGVKWRLKLSTEGAEGLMAAYTDVDGFYRQLNQSWSTHHLSYGQESAPSLHRAMQRLADGYPDPVTGKNTAISSALQVKFKQVFIRRPDQETATAAAGNAAGRVENQ